MDFHTVTVYGKAYAAGTKKLFDKPLDDLKSVLLAQAAGEIVYSGKRK